MTYEFDRNTDLQDDVLAQDVNELQEALEGHEFLTLKAATEITVASGVLVLTQACHKIQPESGTADDIDTISGMDVGDIAVLYISDKGTDTLTFKHGTGNISCPGGLDTSLNEGVIIAYYDGTTVYISLGVGGGGGGVTDHGALTGLSDDDHPQYVKDSEFSQDGGILVGTGAGAFQEETGATVRASIGAIAEISEDITPQLGGDLDMQQYSMTLPLGEPTTDLTGIGVKEIVTIDTNSVGKGCALFLSSDGHYDEADADAIATMLCYALALETGTGSKEVLRYGKFRNDSWNWTPGKIIYVSTTTGTLTDTVPTGEDDVVQPVGHAETDDCIFFNPTPIYITHEA